MKRKKKNEKGICETKRRVWRCAGVGFDHPDDGRAGGFDVGSSGTGTQGSFRSGHAQGGFVLAQKASGQGGAAPIDFILTALPLLALTLSVIGLGLFSYCRNVTYDIAIESARWAALADQPVSAGCERAKLELAQTLAASLSSQVRCDEKVTSGGRMLAVEITVEIPKLGLVSAVGPIKAVGHAFAEIQ